MLKQWTFTSMVLALAITACTPADDARARQKAHEAGDKAREAGRELKKEIHEAGEELRKDADKANQKLKRGMGDAAK